MGNEQRASHPVVFRQRITDDFRRLNCCEKRKSVWCISCANNCEQIRDCKQKEPIEEHSDACRDSPLKECNPDCPAKQKESSKCEHLELRPKNEAFYKGQGFCMDCYIRIKE